MSHALGVKPRRVNVGTPLIVPTNVEECAQGEKPWPIQLLATYPSHRQGLQFAEMLAPASAWHLFHIRPYHFPWKSASWISLPSLPWPDPHFLPTSPADSKPANETRQIISTEANKRSECVEAHLSSDHFF